MKMQKANQAFLCENCGEEVAVHENSSRNHCTKCLYSKHLDLNVPGDRMSLCGGAMKPISIDYNGKKGYMIDYECLKCGKKSKNKTAEDDNWDLIIDLSH